VLVAGSRDYCNSDTNRLIIVLLVIFRLLGMLLVRKWWEETKKSFSCILRHSSLWTSARNSCGQKCWAGKSRSGAVAHQVWPEIVLSSCFSVANARGSRQSKSVKCRRTRKSRYLSAWGPTMMSGFQFKTTRSCRVLSTPFESTGPLLKAEKRQSA
jgi:hypothetical protein